MADLDKDLSRILDNYAAAVLAKDAAALMRLYDPAVRVFDTWGVWSYEGADAWQRAIEGWFTSLGTERVKVRFEAVQAWPAKELTALSAIVSYEGQSAAGETLRTLQNRISWVLRTVGHVPRIVHEHTSAPLGFADAKAILVREPGA